MSIRVCLSLSLVLVLGCKVTTTAPPSSPDAEGNDDVTSPDAVDDSEAAPPDAESNGEVAPPDAVDNSEVAPPEAEDTAPAREPGTLERDAMALCRAAVDDEEIPLLSCKILPDGRDLAGGGRVDVIELSYDEDMAGEVFEAYVVLQTFDEGELDIQTERLGTAMEVPGQSSTYSLGKLKVKGDEVEIRSTETEITIGNTGEPDEDANESKEVAKYITRCSIVDASCSRESLD